MSSKKIHNILFVDHTPFAGGAQLVLADHIAELDIRYFKSFVACTKETPQLPDKYRAAGAEVFLIDMPKLRRFNPIVFWHFAVSIWRLRGIIRQNDIDLVISNTTRASYIASLAVLGLGVPLIWWVRDFLYPKRLFNLLKHIPVRILFVSKAIRNHYLSKSTNKGVVVYVANSIYKQLANVSKDSMANERKRWGIAADDVVVGFMGRLVEEKGAEDVIKAILHVSKVHPNIKGLIVGTGEGQKNNVEPYLHDLIKSEDDQQHIVMAGYQNNEALYYSLFDIFVLSTRDHEAFATSVVQAMMAGCAVIGTDAGGTRELVEDRQTGLLIEPHNVEALTRAIMTLMEDDRLRKKIARHGQERVLQYHREEVVTDELESIYRQALATG